jgi:hypothetical protein
MKKRGVLLQRKTTLVPFGQFDTNYIILRNVKKFQKLFLPKIKKYSEGK